MLLGSMNGFLGTRASFMLDVVFAAMFLVLPVLATSVYLVRRRRQYAWHKRLQLILAAVLLVTVAAFEIDMRLHGWRERAEGSAYLGGEGGVNWVFVSLAVHLVFAVSTALLWIIVLVRALKQFPNPPQPGAHSQSHRFWGWVAAIDMACTAVTGWAFYWLAFVG